MSELLKLIHNLRQGSTTSVQSGLELSGLDKYLHIKRDIEDILCAKMNEISEENGGIVLLIGSAGDGKSHLVSTIRQNEKYCGYSFYNDATESSSPTKTAVDTLKEILVDYDDEHIHTTHKKLVLNINHGKLNTFIEDSEVCDQYSYLRSVVSKIYNNQVEEEVKEEKRIKLVQFNNVQIFEFNKSNKDDYPVDSVFMKKFINKLTIKDPIKNPFYNAYIKSKPKDPNQFDPLIFNYELLSKPEVQDCIIKYIIEAIIRFKLMVTPREFQDFLYSILVYQNIDTYSENKDFVDSLLPSMMFNGKRSKIQCVLSQLDPLRYSSTEHDNDLALLFTSQSVPHSYLNIDDFSPSFKEKVNLLFHKKNLEIVQMIFRLKHLYVYHSESSEYKAFVNVLRNLYNRKYEDVVSLFQIVGNVIPRHYGSYSSPENAVPLNIQGSHYKLFARIDMIPNDYRIIYNSPNDFSLKIRLIWTVHNEEIILPIDYNLYEYLIRLNKGRLSLNYESDKNMTFSRFIRNLVKLSNDESEIIVMTEKNQKFKLTKLLNTLSYKPC